MSAAAGLLKRPLAMLAFAMALLSLSACGFHLKGYGVEQSVAFKEVHIQGLERLANPVKEALVKQLKQQKVTVTSRAELAPLQLVLAKTVQSTSKTSFNAGEATSVLLTYKQSFQVVSLPSKQILLEDRAQAFRDQQVDSGAMLATERERNALRKQMASELVMQILEQTSRAYQASLTTPPQP